MRRPKQFKSGGGATLTPDGIAVSDQSGLKGSHDHIYMGVGQQSHERRTWIVICITAGTMVLEIVSGLAFGSMALLADGWHMASHVSAMGITAVSYYLSRRHSASDRFTFGTGKIGDLGGYTSALLLAFIALIMAIESIKRLVNPVSISYGDAIGVACLGLVVNLVSAWLLREEHEHGQGESPRHDHDHNLRAAYIHVLADALTSILAIVALVIGRLFGLTFLDPLMGIAGAVVICFWAWGLIKQTSSVLLDMNTNEPLRLRIMACMDRVDADARITDLHLWRLGPGHYSAIIAVESAGGVSAWDIKKEMEKLSQLSHITVEVNVPGQG